MKELIRHILKEEDKNQKTKKGIDIAIKILKQDYPYIVGWELTDDSYSNRYNIYVRLHCDVEKTIEFYQSDLSEYFEKRRNEIYDRNFPYVTSILKLNEDMTSDEKYSDYGKLEINFQEIYEMIPDELKIQDVDEMTPKQINVEDFMFVKKNSINENEEKKTEEIDKNIMNFLLRRIKKETKKFNADYDVLEPFELTEYSFEGLPGYGFNSFYNSKKDLELKICKMLYEIDVVDFWIYDLEPLDPKRVKLIKTVRQFLNFILE